jgi:flavin-binding protein dodecin
MSVARVTEISSTSEKSFEEAVRVGIERACMTLRNVKGAWVKEQQVDVRDGKIVDYRVNLMVTFVLDDDLRRHRRPIKRRPRGPRSSQAPSAPDQTHGSRGARSRAAGLRRRRFNWWLSTGHPDADLTRPSVDPRS